MELTLERKNQRDTTAVIPTPSKTILMTPSIGQNYWEYRVQVGSGPQPQAVVGFPKFMTIGIGFAVEEDWNCNYPYSCTTDEILDHIWHNAGPGVSREDARRAIEMIQEAAREDHGDRPDPMRDLKKES